MHESSAQFSEEDVTRLELILEQIRGCTELLLSHLDVAADIGAMTAITIIGEKAKQAADIARAAGKAAAALRKAAG